MEKKKDKLTTTHKKQKFIRIKEYIDPETGEYVPFQENAVEDRDFNFHKVWLRMFVEGLEEIANKKMKLAFWIVDHLDSENKLVYTFRRMAEETGLSIETVIKTMKALQNGDPPFLKKLQSGVYVVNPDILYKGNHKSRMGVIYQFGTIPTPKQAEKIAETQKEQGEAKEKTPSNAPESPQTHEKTSAGENVPAEGEKTQNEPNFELPPLDEFPFEQIRQSAINLRNKCFQQFTEQIPLFENPEFAGKMTEIFQSETDIEFWCWTEKTNLENLPKFHEEWKAKQDKKG